MTEAITCSQGIITLLCSSTLREVFGLVLHRALYNVHMQVNQRSIHSYGSLCVCKSPYILFSVSSSSMLICLIFHMH